MTSAYNWRKSLTVLFILTSFLLLSACGGGSKSNSNTNDLSDNATLSGMSLSEGTLSPSFQSNTANYTVTVANSISSISVTAIVNDTNASLTIDGTAVNTGVASQAISLSVGNTDIDVVVTAEDGTSTQTYTITVTREALSSVASLSAISLSEGTLSPAFHSKTTSYSIDVPNTTQTITITPTKTHSQSSVTVNGATVSASRTVTLSVGSNTVTIFVTAEDTTTTQTYTLTVTRLEPPIVSHELLDPNPSESSNFGANVLILENGNIVVTDTRDDSFGTNTGAVHLYNTDDERPLASIYGDQTNDELGSGGIKELSNGNFVIITRFDDSSDSNGVITEAGSVTLINGLTGAVIGTPLRGDQDNDLIGNDNNAVTILDNGNYVVVAPDDDDLAGGIINAGSVTLIDGTTGAIIGTPFIGDDASDHLGRNGIVALANNNFVILSDRDDDGILQDSGSAMLVNGTTGALIGTPLRGAVNDDRFGAQGFALDNGNYVLLSTTVNNGAILNAGSVTLVDGSTGSIIGTPIRGDSANDNIGQSGLALANNNFVVASRNDDVNGISDAGSVMLINGTTGALIGTPLSGDDVNDRLGTTSLTALIGSNNFVVTTLTDDNGAAIDAGSAMLVNGTTGAIIGTPFRGNLNNDNVGNRGAYALNNGNYVVSSSVRNLGSFLDVGSVNLFNGTTGASIGIGVVGNVDFDMIGGDGITVLDNSNYIVSSSRDDNNGTLADSGSVMLVNGSTGIIINTLRGTHLNDSFGRFGATVLANDNFVVSSPLDRDNNDIALGSVTVVDGNTGNIIGTPTIGDTGSDLNSISISASTTANHFVLGASNWNNNNVLNSGFVKLIVETESQ